MPRIDQSGGTIRRFESRTMPRIDRSGGRFGGFNKA
jgi:hypothetical protein